MTSENRSQHELLNPSQLEMAARMILGHDDIHVRPGSWWSYNPQESLITYPAQLLGEWSIPRLIGAICHQTAEVRYTGIKGTNIISQWLHSQSQHGLSYKTGVLLVNTINDMRINRRYMNSYPGAHQFLKELYCEVPELHKKEDHEDLQSIGVDGRAHHFFLDALTDRWSQEEWGHAPSLYEIVPQSVRRAVDKSWPSVKRAAGSDDIEKMLDVVRGQLVSQYKTLAELSPVTISDDKSEQATLMSEAVGPDNQLDVGLAGGKCDDPNSAPEREEAIEQAPQKSSTQKTTTVGPQYGEQIQTNTKPSNTTTRRGPPALEELGGERWKTSLVEQMRGDNEVQIDYTRFDYRMAVSILNDQICDTIEGDELRPGLATIMNRRRHGMNDAVRRPRKRRTGDQGDIDVEHTERLITNPLSAFLKGTRIAREDQQRDFASAILLDISGSMVQKGYPTRKFDRLVETAVLFIEIHERLQIPFEVHGFSSVITPLWSFKDCIWPRGTTLAQPQGTRDHSDSFKRLYQLDHKDTDDAGALRAVIDRCRDQDGLKSIFVVTDGISSDPSDLRRVLMDLDRSNRDKAENQRLKVLAFGVGVVKSEFRLAYQPTQFGKPINSCTSLVVDDITRIPSLVRDAVDARIRMC